MHSLPLAAVEGLPSAQFPDTAQHVRRDVRASSAPSQRQAEKFLACPGIVTNDPRERRGHGSRPTDLGASQRHTQMLCLQHNSNSLGAEFRFYAISLERMLDSVQNVVERQCSTWVLMMRLRPATNFSTLVIRERQHIRLGCDAVPHG